MDIKIIIILVCIIYAVISYIFIKNSTKERDNTQCIKIVKVTLVGCFADELLSHCGATILYDDKRIRLYGKENYLIAQRYGIPSEINAKYDKRTKKIIELVNS